MEYSLDIHKCPAYLRINFSGSWTKENGKRIIIEINDICRRNNCRHLLIDIRKAQNIEFSTMADFTEAELSANLFRGLNHKVAILLSDQFYSAAQWFETVSRNRCLNTYRFKHESDAIDWLCGKQSIELFLR